MMTTTPNQQLLSMVSGIREKLSGFPKLTDGLDIPVDSTSDITVYTKWRKTPVRVYLPKGPGPYPTVFHLHGGAFCLSSNADDEPMARQLAHEAGCAVFSVDYGLAPEHPFPSALEEAFDVIDQVVSNASAYNIDPERVALAGNSAGANLATALCILAAERKTFRIKALSAIYPVLDLTIPHASKLTGKAAGSALGVPMIDLLIGQAYLSGDTAKTADPLVSPLLVHDMSIFPSTILVSAERCPFTPEHARFFQRLQDAGIECVHKYYPGVEHGFMDMGGQEVLQRDCKTLVCAQMKSWLNR